MFEQYGWDSGTRELGSGYIAYQTPMFLNLGGNWYGSLDYVGHYGNFWSPVVVTAEDAYFAYDNSDDGVRVRPSDDGAHRFGLSVRCVAR